LYNAFKIGVEDKNIMHMLREDFKFYDTDNSLFRANPASGFF